MSIPSPTNATAFWEYIQKEKMAKNDYDFSRYVFPDFLYSKSKFFWICTRSDESDFRLFPQDVSFAGATFLADAKFDFLNFSGKTNFQAQNSIRMPIFERRGFSDAPIFPARASLETQISPEQISERMRSFLTPGFLDGQILQGRNLSMRLLDTAHFLD